MGGIKATTLEAYQLLHEGAIALTKAELVGIHIDVEYCKIKKEELTRRIKIATDKFMETALFKKWNSVYRQKTNIDSPYQLAYILYKILKIAPTKTTDGGQGATDEETLNGLEIDGLPYLLETRKLRKIRDTYLDAFLREQVNGVLHPFFNLHTVKTYRSSSDRINFQNIPKRDPEAMDICRKAMFPSNGHMLVEADYSGVEVRVSVCYHKDPNMKRYIEDPTTDMHGDTACQIFLLDKLDKSIEGHATLRQAAKNGFVFPQFYGDYYVNCAQNTGIHWGKLTKKKWKSTQGITLGDTTLADHLIRNKITSYNAFEKHVQDVESDFWGRRFAVYQQWKDKLWESYQKTGFVKLFTGFECRGPMRKNECLNTPIQGSAFHCLLWSLTRITKISEKERWKSKIIGQIHDSMVLDVDPNELEHITQVIKKVSCVDITKKFTWLNVPLEIEVETYPINGSWGSKK